MHKKKRAQVTVYIIIGIVILCLAISLFYLKSLTRGNIGMQEIVKSQKIPNEVKPITNYITISLDDAAKKGLYLIGMQGGYLNQSQGGSIILDNTNSILDNENYTVYYGITRQKSQYSFLYWPNPPNYPWKNFPYYTSNYQNPYFYSSFNIFGVNNLTPLNGSNQDSIESQLKEYITKYLEDNINLTIFEEQGFDIDEDINNINVSVLIGENDVTVFLEYPLGIKKRTSNIITNISYFYTNPQIKLRKIYNLAENMITKDIMDISFDITEISILDNYLPDADVEKTEYGPNDIIIIRDNSSMLYAEPYTFQFARENRRPALRYIPPTAIPINILNLKADDPDEDILIYDPSPTKPSVNDGYLEDWQII